MPCISQAAQAHEQHQQHQQHGHGGVTLQFTTQPDSPNQPSICSRPSMCIQLRRHQPPTSTLPHSPRSQKPPTLRCMYAAPVTQYTRNAITKSYQTTGRVPAQGSQGTGSIHVRCSSQLHERLPACVVWSAHPAPDESSSMRSPACSSPVSLAPCVLDDVSVAPRQDTISRWRSPLATSGRLSPLHTLLE